VTEGPPPYSNSREHLFDELRRIDLLCKRAVTIVRAVPPSQTAAPASAFEGTADAIVESSDLLSEPWLYDDETGARLEQIDEEIQAERAAIDARVQASDAAGVRLSLPRLAALAGLWNTHVDLLLIGLAPELEPRYESLFAYLQNDSLRRRPSADLALSLVSRSRDEKAENRAMLAPGGALLHFGLVELLEESGDRDPTLLRRFIKVQEPVVSYLLDTPPAALSPGHLIVPQNSIESLEAAAHTREALSNLVAALERTGAERALIQVLGGPTAPVDQAARAIGHAFGRPMLWIDLEGFEASASNVTALVRDAALWNAIVVLRRPDTPRETDVSSRSTGETNLWRRLRETTTPVIAAGRTDDAGVLPPDRRLWRIEVDPPDYEQRRSIWLEALGGAVSDTDAARLADLLPYSGDRVRQVSSLAHANAALRDPSDPRLSLEDVLNAARASWAPNLRRFATVRDVRYSWNDLVLPDSKMRQLRAIAARVERRRIVHRDWGFGDKHARGLGVTVLFSGPSGTGKTMAAEVLASELGLDLIQIDLSAVVSKYIGDTEKNLSIIFREAELSQSLLFFDEADALYGRRTKTEDAHDRYANIEVNYLLQRIELYEGLVVLATNFVKNLDEAFMRRLNDVIEFPSPDDHLRERIWRQHFPPRAPVADDINFGLLGQQFKVTGGKIRNAAISAAYFAAQEAGENARITMKHILRAIQAEYRKEGKVLVKADLGPYAKLVEDSEE
jgi:hypothetical protein